LALTCGATKDEYKESVSAQEKERKGEVRRGRPDLASERRPIIAPQRQGLKISMPSLGGTFVRDLFTVGRTLTLLKHS